MENDTTSKFNLLGTSPLLLVQYMIFWYSRDVNTSYIYGWLFAGFVVLCVGSIYSGLCSCRFSSCDKKCQGYGTDRRMHVLSFSFSLLLGQGFDQYMIMKLVCDQLIVIFILWPANNWCFWHFRSNYDQSKKSHLQNLFHQTRNNSYVEL